MLPAVTDRLETKKGSRGPAAPTWTANYAAPVYNPSGPVRILGVGSLTDDEKQSLSEDEKRKL
jgi:hypothetical protein